MPQPRTTCPDCDGALEDIRLIDATDLGLGAGLGHVELSYASPDATRSQFTRTIQSAGKVKAKMCTACGRIILFGDHSVRGLRRD